MPREHRWAVYATRSLFVIADGNAETDPAKDVSFLGISRESGVAQEGKDTREGLQQKLKQLNGAAGRPRPMSCTAVLGCLTTHHESFLLLVADATLVADVDGQRIYEVGRCEALPFSNAEVAAEVNTAVAAVKLLLGKGFYYSPDFDITRRLQQRLLSGDSGGAADLMLAADDRFAWNRQLVEPLLVQEGVTARWFTPIMQGFVQLRGFSATGAERLGQDPALQMLLVARRSRRRAGTRFNARGLDDEGEAGNWVETEHLVRINSPVASRAGWVGLVQVRGSAPVFWEQASAMRGITVTRGTALGNVAFEKHHDWIAAEYGDVFYVNLLSEAPNKRETEGLLTAALHRQLGMRQGVRWKHLDFNALVTGEELLFDRDLHALASQLAEPVAKFGFLDATHGASSNGSALRRQQQGVIRTNCFDCLDRTNMLQQELVWQWVAGCLAEYGKELQALMRRGTPTPATKQAHSGALGDIFSAFGGGPGGEIPRPALQGLIREMWADLGDALSEQYTGTASTMGTALRQGGQSALTMLEKGWRSVNRAYCAHFEDGVRQAALDLLLGKHKLPRAPGAAEVRRAPCGSLTVAVVTWNLHGRACWETPGSLRALLRGACGAPSEHERPPDVVIFCLQEMLELTAANVMLQAHGDDVSHRSFEDAAERALPEALGERFVKVSSIGMVGLYVAAFAAERLRSQVSGVAADRKASGLYGQTGNKGAVGVRFDVAKTSVCALSVHLDSGQGKAVERAAQLREVLQSSLFAGGPGRAPVPIKGHDLVVAAGDFNFRLAVPKTADTMPVFRQLAGVWPEDPSMVEACAVGEGVRGASVPASVTQLFGDYDELKGQAAESLPAEDAVREAGLMEGPVLFPPTYRMYEGRNAYDTERTPAWCDRVLHSKVGVVRRRYCAVGGLVQSDHRPVAAVLQTNLLAVPGGQPPTSPTRPSAAPSPSAAPPPPTPGPPSAPHVAELLGPSTAPAAPVQPDLLGGEFSEPQPVLASAALPAAGTTQAKAHAASPANLLDGMTPEPQAPKRVEPPGEPLPAGAGVSVGQLVLAEHAGGWFYASVTRLGNGTCDVAWRRPQGADWGRDATNERYLCSTGADETMHGDRIPLASRIRLPGGVGGGPDLSSPSRAAAAAPPPPRAAGGGVDLLGAEGPSSAGTVDLLG